MKESKLFWLSSSPHVFREESTRRIMYITLATLALPAAGAIYFFGPRAILLIVASTLGAWLAEFLSLLARGKGSRRALSESADGSAFITGVLLALTLPPGFPLWAAALGSAFGIAIGKQVFGGLGQNIFNPALLGRAFLMAAFPVASTTWSAPRTLAPEAWTGATPLAMAKFQGVHFTDYLSLFLGNTGGSLGETSALLIILGGIVLIVLGYVDWVLPLSYLGTVALLGGLFWAIAPSRFPQDPLFHLLSGGLMLGAFYMITDMVTSPTTRLGNLIYGVLAGVILVAIRLFGGLPEGVMYSILLANAVRPWVDRLTVPRRFGEVKAK